MSEDTEESQSIHEVTRLEDQDDDKEKEYSKGEYMYLFFANSYKVEGTSCNRASGHTQTTCVQCTWQWPIWGFMPQLNHFSGQTRHDKNLNHDHT